MAEKATIATTVLKVKHVTVSADGTAPATIGLEVEGGHDLQLHLAPDVLAALEAMLAKASVEQAKHQPIQ
jgi:hypothetical protein